MSTTKTEARMRAKGLLAEQIEKTRKSEEALAELFLLLDKRLTLQQAMKQHLQVLIDFGFTRKQLSEELGIDKAEINAILREENSTQSTESTHEISEETTEFSAASLQNENKENAPWNP